MFPLLLACLSATEAPPPEGGATPALTGDGFWDRPFPSDDRLVDGRPSLEGFPGGNTVPIFETYLAVAPTLDGWGTNSPIYVRFTEPPDADLVPSPAESIESDSPILLLDVDPSSPRRGEAIPIVTEFYDDADAYTADNLLAVAPLLGFPLRPHTRYALIIRPPYAAIGQMPSGWEEEEGWADVVGTLTTMGIPTSHVAAATVFTTQDPVRELASIAWSIQSNRIGRPRWEPTVTLREDSGGHLLFEGYVTVPVWQEGERPYRDVGGGFVLDAFGRPEVQGWERVRFALTVPDSGMPEAGFPLVVYSHGTGGDHLSFATGSAAEGPAMAYRGVAMFGISQPLHGDRATPDTSPEFDTFNYGNPASGRTSFRQGAADQLWLASRLAEAGVGFEFEGQRIEIDHARLCFFGHSQGAMVGALGASWLGNDVVAVGLSAAGGGTAASALAKIDPIAIEPLLAAMVGLESGSLTTLHPVMMLVQMLSEATDPLNYSPYWFAEEPPWRAHPVPILMTEGLEDTFTPPVSIEALATSGRIPIVGTMRAEPPGFDLRDLGAESLPTEANVTGWDDSSLTAGMAQFAGQGHFAIYDDRDAKDLYKDFLESAAAGAPELR